MFDLDDKHIEPLGSVQPPRRNLRMVDVDQRFGPG